MLNLKETIHLVIFLIVLSIILILAIMLNYEDLNNKNYYSSEMRIQRECKMLYEIWNYKPKMCD